MKTIDDVEYVSMADLVELWEVKDAYTIRNRIYAEMRKGNHFPAPDIKNRAKGFRNGEVGGSNPALWRADRLPELQAWWDRYQHGRNRYSVPTDTPKAEEVTVFTDVTITLTIAEQFPKLRESHILAIVRNESGESEHYFITREQAEFIMDMFR